jgi:hypothetical protein
MISASARNAPQIVQFSATAIASQLAPVLDSSIAIAGIVTAPRSAAELAGGAPPA